MSVLVSVDVDVVDNVVIAVGAASLALVLWLLFECRRCCVLLLCVVAACWGWRWCRCHVSLSVVGVGVSTVVGGGAIVGDGDGGERLW